MNYKRLFSLMRSKPAVTPESFPDDGNTPLESERDQFCENIEAVLEFYGHEEQKISRSQRTRLPATLLAQGSTVIPLVINR